MRKLLRTYLPDPSAVRNNRWMRPFANTLLHPRLWHLNRHSAAGGVAVGLFCGLIPGPLQMLGAALCCIVLRVNLPLALLSTLYTNPFTIVPLYLLGFQIGDWLLGTGGAFSPPPAWGELSFSAWLSAGLDWLVGLGKPLALGLLLLASGLATVGYFAVKGVWRIHLLRAIERRRSRRTGRSPADHR